MAALAEAVEIETQDGFSGVATHDRFGMTVQSWASPKVITRLVLGQDLPDGIGFIPMDRPGAAAVSGADLRSDVNWSDEDYVLAVTDPVIQEALARLRGWHDWIRGGRAGDPPTFAQWGEL